tara:strand:+ start:375 stop:578 length:204 start_codon:yes stop_codon:yes gene_type:complete
MEEVNKEVKRPALVELERRIDEYEQKVKAAYEHEKRMNKILHISISGVIITLSLVMAIAILNSINYL